jgi:hypothetical protein
MQAAGNSAGSSAWAGAQAARGERALVGVDTREDLLRGPFEVIPLDEILHDGTELGKLDPP